MEGFAQFGLNWFKRSQKCFSQFQISLDADKLNSCNFVCSSITARVKLYAGTVITVTVPKCTTEVTTDVTTEVTTDMIEIDKTTYTTTKSVKTTHNSQERCSKKSGHALYLWPPFWNCFKIKKDTIRIFHR